MMNLVAEEPGTRNRFVSTTLAILDELFGPPDRRHFRVALWDGSVNGPTSEVPVSFTIRLNHPGALRRMLLPPSELAVGEAYLRGDFDIDGNFEEATGLADAVTSGLTSPIRLARLMNLLRSLPGEGPISPEGSVKPSGARLRGLRHSRQRDRAAVRSHYDVGNDFYALWLDSQMVYSCAYFENQEQDLETAQRNKLDHVCRKLRLRPGERFLDVGCGWGALVRHAAAHYGVEATGITLSESQAELARDRISTEGLGERCTIEVRDYRDLPRDAAYDKIASIGMVEHVGSSRLHTYFSEMYRLLAPGGVFLNHGIVELPGAKARGLREVPARAIWRPRAFIDRYVFPDGELLPLGEAITRAEEVGFETRDAESLREHYALTLRHWVRRLEASHAEAAALAGERTYRIWRLYMSGAARGFATARLNVVQTLLSKPDGTGRSSVRLTREDWYAGDRPSALAAHDRP